MKWLKTAALAALMSSSLESSQALAEDKPPYRPQEDFEPSIELCVEQRQNYDSLYPGLERIIDAAVEDVANYLTTQGIPTDISDSSDDCDHLIFSDLESFALAEANYLKEDRPDILRHPFHKDRVNDVLDDSSFLQDYDIHSQEAIKENIEQISKPEVEFHDNIYIKDHLLSGVENAYNSQNSDMSYDSMLKLIDTLEDFRGFSDGLQDDGAGKAYINTRAILNDVVEHVASSKGLTEFDFDGALQNMLGAVAAHEVLHGFRLVHPWQYANSNSGRCEEMNNIMGFADYPQLTLNDYHMSGLQVEHVRSTLMRRANEKAASEGIEPPYTSYMKPATHVYSEYSRHDYTCGDNEYKINND